MSKEKTKWSSPLFIIIMGGLAAFAPLSIDMYLPALPEVMRSLDASTSSVQLSLTWFMFGMAVGNVALGTLSDSTERRKPLIYSLVIYFITSILIALTTNIWVLIVLRFIQGFGGGAGMVLSRAIATDLFEGVKLTKFLSLLMLVNGVAPVISPMLGGFILGFSSFRMIFWVLAAFSLLMLIGVLFKVNETLAHHERRPLQFKNVLSDFKVLLTTRSFIVPTLIQGLTFGIFFGYMAASPFILQNIYPLSAQQYSYVFAMTGLGLVMTVQVTSKLIDYFDQHTLFRVFSAIQIVGGILVIVALMNHWSLWVLLPSFLLIVSPIAGIATLGYAIAMEGLTRGKGSASSLIGLLQFAIGAFATPLVGIQGEHSVIPFVIVLIVIMVLIAVLHVFQYFKVEKHIQ